MCIGDAAPEEHQCVKVCPVCYIFTPENALQLLSGQSIELGTLNVFIEVGQIGCRMCQMLCNMWELGGEVVQRFAFGFIHQLTGPTDLSIRCPG